MDRPPAWGIVITTQPQRHSATLREIRFTLTIGRRRKNQLFITSPRIRNGILAYQFISREKEVGEFIAIISQHDHSMNLCSVFPTESTKFKVAEHLGIIHPDTDMRADEINQHNPLWNAGIGALAETVIKRYLKKKFPGRMVIQNIPQTRARLRQLEARGIGTRKAITIERDHELTRRQAINNHRKAAGKPKLRTFWKPRRTSRRR